MVDSSVLEITMETFIMVDSSVLEITMETFIINSIMKDFMQFAAHPMLPISFENSKRIMLVMWLEYLSL